MPRAKNPQQAVLDYFETADLSQARATAGFVGHILKRRAAADEAALAMGAATAPKPKKRKKPGPKPGQKVQRAARAPKPSREITPTTPTPVSEAN
jgi:hypothetical protein